MNEMLIVVSCLSLKYFLFRKIVFRSRCIRDGKIVNCSWLVLSFTNIRPNFLANAKLLFIKMLFKIGHYFSIAFWLSTLWQFGFKIDLKRNGKEERSGDGGDSDQGMFSFSLSHTHTHTHTHTHSFTHTHMHCIFLFFLLLFWSLSQGVERVNATKGDWGWICWNFLKSNAWGGEILL